MAASRAWGAALVLVLAGAVGVAAPVVGLSLGGMARVPALAALVLALAVAALSWPTPASRRTAALFCLGCALGMGSGVLVAAQVTGQARVQSAMESAGFQMAMESVLARRDCALAREVLDQDLAWLPGRPATAAIVRKDMWDRAASLGCIPGARLGQVHDRLRAHVLAARPPPGMETSQVLTRMGLVPD